MRNGCWHHKRWQSSAGILPLLQQHQFLFVTSGGHFSWETVSDLSISWPCKQKMLKCRNVSCDTHFNMVIQDVYKPGKLKIIAWVSTKLWHICSKTNWAMELLKHWNLSCDSHFNNRKISEILTLKLYAISKTSERLFWCRSMTWDTHFNMVVEDVSETEKWSIQPVLGCQLTWPSLWWQEPGLCCENKNQFEADKITQLWLRAWRG